MDTVEKENELAEGLEENGEEDQVESYSKSQEPVESGHEDDEDEHTKMIKASKYENAGIIWFATNS